jgi:hypothetical protein
MTGYLQRLAERAGGVAEAPSIVPARHNVMTKDPSRDQFAADETATSLVRRAHPLEVIQEGMEDSDAERDQNSTKIPGQRLTGRAEPKQIDDSSTPIEVKPTSQTSTMMIEPPTSRNEVSSPALSKTEPSKSHVEAFENELDARIRSAQVHQHDVSESFVTPRPLEETLPFDVRPQVATSKLEPPPADTFDHEPVPPDEPRLVIGQLRVDVIPSAPSKEREVVRTVTRTVSSNQSRRMSFPTSRLRFGLGQM